MLVQVALVAFAMLALLGLVVDAGMLHLTQGQMQTAVDGAAIEGIRNRDAILQGGPGGVPVPNAFASDCVRRTVATRLAAAQFDDTIYAVDGDPGYRFGAGPVIGRTAGYTTLHAGQTITAADPYDPRLQLNQQNAVYGDMVSGRFTYSVDPAPAEDSTYARTDFVPSELSPLAPAALPECPDPDAPLPSTWPASSTAAPLTSADHEAFLVRLRRSNEWGDVDGQLEPGVASSGPSLPLLFGQGAPIHGDSPDSAYSVRRDGFTVRATAIARAQPAMQVGLPRTVAPIQPGVTPFVLLDTFAAGPAPAAGVPVTLDPASGTLCPGATCAGPTAPAIAGRFVVATIAPTPAWLATATVGRVATPAVPRACATALPQAAGYAPVVATVAGLGPRVVGFTTVQLIRDPARPADLCAGLLLRAPSRVAASNATALLPVDWQLPVTTSATSLRELMDRHFQAAGRPAYQPVLAPVLAR
ncbi:MAG: hypothetical protein FJW29_12235 [Acidobacteria bacterium]|nr:hypothetical protein [Acidobacteriota bacterium]